MCYLQQNVDANASFRDWDAKESLNLQIAGSYDFYCVTVLNVEFLLIKPNEFMTIQKIKIHVEYIEEKTGLNAAVQLENGTPYRIKKMLEERIPFISVDRQMYLPFMALHIRRKRVKTRELVVHEKFTAATQLMYLYMLYQDIAIFSAEELADNLKVSVMTILRGMKELEKIGLVCYEITGQTRRKKIFKRINKKEYYSRGKEYLQNPVKKSIYVKYIPVSVEVLKGGLYALSEQTMLAEPMHEIYAVDSKNEIDFHDLIVDKEQAIEERLPEVQLMMYNIRLLARQGCVDPVSLIKSLNEKDERIEMAIDEMMEGTEWFGV